jgi:hypothetical protein
MPKVGLNPTIQNRNVSGPMLSLSLSFPNNKAASDKHGTVCKRRPGPKKSSKKEKSQQAMCKQIKIIAL